MPETKTLAVLQPGFLPWLGFFDQMARSDFFVLYDDVQFDKNGWRNRNRVKDQQGKPIWLTVPVHVTEFPLVNTVTIDNGQRWAKKMVGTLQANYAKAPFFKTYFSVLEACLNQPWVKLVDLDLALIRLIREWLGIETPIYLSSELGITGGQSERLLNLCRHFNASHYLSGNAAKSYLELSLFEEAGIEVVWQDYEHPSYRQLHGEFVPCLSIIDILFNCGPDSLSIVTNVTKREGAP